MNRNAALLIAVLFSAIPNLQAQHGRAAGRGAQAVRSAHSGRGFNHYRGGYYPYGWDDSYGDYYGDWFYRDDYYIGRYNRFQDPREEPAPKPSLLAPAQEVVSAPQPGATAVVHEYSWSEPPADAATAFAIVSKNGTLQRAIAVWVQEDRLCFVTPDGASRYLLLNDIDRQSTAQLNRELKLNSPLPI